MQPGGSGHEHWSSRFAFLMAAIGSSVGLGNLWRFSAEAGENGGGAFVLIYLACVIFIGIPTLTSEYVIGRGSAAASAVGSVTDLARSSGRSRHWSLLAWIGMTAAFLVVAFYCVVAGWVMAYIPKFVLGSFTGRASAEIAGDFGRMISDPWASFWYFTAFVIITAVLVARGVNKGIELATTVLMPVFFLLLAALAIYGLASAFGTTIVVDAGTASEREANAGAYALSWLFTPDFSKVTPTIITRALGQAFFSIGIGAGIMITYGSYLHHGVQLPRSAAIVALSDTAVALVAGLAIFPIVFAHGLAPDSGPGLFFETLPVALLNAPGGELVGAAFFVLAIVAAVTSSISLLEVSVAWLVEKSGLTRPEAAAGLGFMAWAIGGGVIYSTAYLDLLDTTTSTLMLPLSGLLVVLFVGWRLKKDVLERELEGASKFTRQGLLVLIRFVAPIAIGAILAFGVWEKYVKPMMPEAG